MLMRCKRECEKVGEFPLFPERCGGFAEAPYLCLLGDPYLLVSRPRSAVVETRVFLEGSPGAVF